MKRIVATVGLLGLLAIPQPAFAQADVFFGIMNHMIQEGARQQQMQREREHRQQEIYRQHEAQIALVRRAQTALKELGFYAMAVDCSVGPGTRRAIADYQRAFNLPERQMQESDILALERRAAAGFRSHEEGRHAESRGFSTRSDIQAATAAGFDNARDWDAARRAGVESAEKWRAYRASGFSTYRDYLDGQRRGFATRRALELAERDGFDTAQEHEAFRRSGARNRDEFLRQRERIEAAGRAREECLEAVSERDWPRAAPRCRQAAVVIRDDDALLAARATAERQLDLAITTIRADRQRLERDLELAKDALALAQADLDDLAQGSGEDDRAEARRDEARSSRDERAGDLEGLAQALADADSALERAERGRVRASCLEDSEAGRWSAALAACDAAVAADSSDRESAELLAQAQVKHEAEREQAEEQRRVMALAEARRESAAVIEALDAFAASGGVFQSPLPLTRAVVNLKAALTRNEPHPLLQAQAALADLLAQEQPFQQFRQARLAATRAAEASALTKAEGNARRLEAFIRDYLGRNVLSPHAAKLLALQEKLDEVLASDDPDRITRQQAEAQVELDRLGLGGESRSFTIAPRIAASDLREQEAEAAQARLTLVTARERAGALLEELEEFVKTGARFEAAIPVARGIAALRSEREGGDMAAIEDARRTLESALGGEATFADFRSRRLEAQAVATNDGAVTAAARLARKRAFIESHVGANPLDPNLDALLAAHGAISEALDADTPGGLALTLDEMRRRLDQLGLADDLARYAAMEAKPDDGAEIARAPGGLAITALNAALLEGDARDGVQHRLTPIWFEANRIAQAREAVIARDEERLRVLAAMRQDAEGQALLARERREEAEARRQAREAELRSTYAQEARAAFNDIEEAALAIVDGLTRADRPDMPFAALGKWRDEHVGGGWEFIGKTAGLVDFGLADWSGRRLEAVVIRLELESRNRTLGSYHEACIVMGYLIDAEFERRRDFFQADCTQADRTADDWRAGRNFASRWVARLEE